MRSLLLTFSALVFVAAWLPNTLSLDYSPCLSSGKEIRCEEIADSSEVLEAFRRNRNNSAIDYLYLAAMDDMTDDVLDEIMGIVASAASHNLNFVFFSRLPKLERVPAALRHFDQLRELYVEYNDQLKILPSGSMVFSSNSLTSLSCKYNPNLAVIEEGAFQGNFHSTTFFVYDNHLTEFAEAVFKPILFNSTAHIEFYGNPTYCTSCSLAWFVRDNRQFLDRIFGYCYNPYGFAVDFKDVDVETLRHC